MSHSGKIEISLLRRSPELRGGGVPHDGVGDERERDFPDRRTGAGH